MASAEFDDKSDEKRPTVQVGDPFSEKLLLEACLEIMAKDCVIATQAPDLASMGAAQGRIVDCSTGDFGAQAVFYNGGPARDTSVDHELDEQLDQARTLEGDGADMLDAQRASVPPPAGHAS